jgi:ribonuclease HI
MSKGKVYAYYIDKGNKGVTESWPECQKICKGKNSKYKSFTSISQAEKWLENGGASEASEKTNKKYYAYLIETTGISGIVNTWALCQSKTKGSKARYKSFKSEKEAKEWLSGGASYTYKKDIKANLPEGIYFDAGTGRGIGVEVRVTDYKGTSILSQYLPKEKITEHGNYLCKEGSTNNFGELLGIYVALKIAIKNNIMNIFGDSKLVLDYWSKGFIKKDNVNEETYDLSQKVKKLRQEFEKLGGKIEHISGDFNPADLGFHR